MVSFVDIVDAIEHYLFSFSKVVMIDVRELRVGNRLFKDGIVVTIDARSIFDIWDKSEQYSPIPLIIEMMENIDGFVRSKDFERGGFLSSKKERFVEYKYRSFRAVFINGHFQHVSANSGSTTLKHIKYLHQLQNLYFMIYDNELIIKP